MAIPKIPIDIKTLTKAGQVFESDADTETVVEVLVDTSVSKELVSYTRKLLNVKPGALELNIAGFSDEMPKLNNDASLTVIVAGSSPFMRRLMEIALWSNMNCVVLTENSSKLISTVAEEDALEIAETIIEVDVAGPFEKLEHDFTRWCVAHLPDLRLSFGAAFPFMRKLISRDLTYQTTLENAVIAAVFLLPGADLPLLTLNQCKLLYQIAVINNIPLTRERLVELAIIIVSAFGLRGITRLALRKLGPVGWLVRGTIAGGATLAMGHIFNHAYSHGGGLMETIVKKRDNQEAQDGTVGSNETP